MSDVSTSNQDKVNTLAHLVQTTGNHLSHTKVHAEQLRRSVTPKQREFNMDHLDTHLNGAIEHVQKIVDHLTTNYPQEAKALKDLETVVPRTGETSRVVKKMAALGKGNA